MRQASVTGMNWRKELKERKIEISDCDGHFTGEPIACLPRRIGVPGGGVVEMDSGETFKSNSNAGQRVQSRKKRAGTNEQ
jgi:hypothetical protein